jgi:DNA-directed RNA polymerase specialized sigma24 family protein
MPPELLPWPRQADDGTPLGIDVSAKRADIRRIVVAGFGRSAERSGVGVEDLVQTVFLAIWRRNRMPCAFDPRRSSFGHYVHMVGDRQLKNLMDARKRTPLAEEDHPEVADDTLDTDARLGAVAELADLQDDEERDALGEERRELWEIALQERVAQRQRVLFLGLGTPAPTVVKAKPRGMLRKARPAPAKPSPAPTRNLFA